MKSNINRGYQVKKNSDGSICISFDVPKLSGLSQAAGCGSLLLVIVGVFAGLFVAAVTDIRTLGFVVGAVAIYGLFKLGNKLFAPGKQEISVFPEVGIKHGNVQLALSDIQTIGFFTLTSQHGIAGYVYALALGQEVRLSGNVSPSLAEGLAREVRTATGISWA